MVYLAGVFSTVVVWWCVISVVFIAVDVRTAVDTSAIHTTYGINVRRGTFHQMALMTAIKGLNHMNRLTHRFFKRR